MSSTYRRYGLRVPVEPPPKSETDNVCRWLEQRDAASLADRARWYIEVEQVVNKFPAIAWGLVAGAQESSWFLLEAVESYRRGLFLSALVCAHATCEQELAGRVAHRPNYAPKDWQRWGLGRLIVHAEALGWHSRETIALLKELNANRRSVYHLREMHAPDSLFARTYRRQPFICKNEINSRMHEELRRNALEGIRAAFSVRVDDPIGGDPLSRSSAARDTERRRG